MANKFNVGKELSDEIRVQAYDQTYEQITRYIVESLNEK